MKFKMSIQPEDMINLFVLFICVLTGIIGIICIMICIFAWLRTLTQTDWLIVGIVTGAALITTYLIYYKTSWWRY